MGFLQGKRVLIVGVASPRSIAAGIALAMAREGAEIAFTYQTEKLKSRVEKIASECGSDPALIFPCDVASDNQINDVFVELAKHWDGLDTIIHSVGFAPRDQLQGSYVIASMKNTWSQVRSSSVTSSVLLLKKCLTTVTCT